jgi:hypothetical protein
VFLGENVLKIDFKYIRKVLTLYFLAISMMARFWASRKQVICRIK